MINLSQKIKNEFPNFPVIWAGWHPSIEAKQTLEHEAVDIIVKGQGEVTMFELIKCLREDSSFEDLESFPGVGHKTASVVMSQAFDIPAFPVDTHVHRLMYRWGLSSGRSVQDTEKQAKRLFPKNKWNKLHLQIVFYGREYCPAKNFNANNCPITSVVGRRSLFK